MAKTKVKQPKLGFRKLKSMLPSEIAALLPGGTIASSSHDLTNFHPQTDEELARPIPEGVCLMEAVAWVTGAPHSDHPKCADPQLTEIAIGFNDSHSDGDDDYENLLNAIPALVGSKTGSARVRFKRAKHLCRIMLNKFLAEMHDYGFNSPAEERIISMLEDITLTNYASFDDAAFLLELLVDGEDEGTLPEETRRIITALRDAWNSDGISAKKYSEIMGHSRGDFSGIFSEGNEQAEILCELGYIRS